MRLEIEKLREIYGDSIIADMQENMDSLAENMNLLVSYGFKDPYDIVETVPYICLLEPEQFQEKLDRLVEKLGVEFVEKLSEDNSLWGDVDD